jgi:hypothetical protein
MKTCALVLLATVVTAWTAETPLKISLLGNDILCVRASRLPEHFAEQLRAASPTNRLAGTVLDLRFADGAASDAADCFNRTKSPLVILVNSQTRGTAAALATQLRASASAIVIGSTNSPGEIAPDIAVAASVDDEKRFQDNPYATADTRRAALFSGTNSLLTFVDHTSEAELVRKRIKDGDEDGEPATPRAAPPLPVIADPALARAVDLLKALAVLHQPRG